MLFSFFAVVIFLLLPISGHGKAEFNCLKNSLKFFEFPQFRQIFRNRYKYVRTSPRRVKRKYDRFTVGWEFEFRPRDNPDVLKYYRARDISSSQWKKMSLGEQQAHVKSLTERSKKGDVILEKLEDAPRFLSSTATKDTQKGSLLEINGDPSAVTNDLDEFDRQLDWVNGNLGSGIFHGTTVFEEGIVLKSAQSLLKWDADIAYVESLAAGFSRYLGDGTQPAKFLSHYTTGIRSMSVEAQIAQQLSNPSAMKSGENLATKYLYSIILRKSDSYGGRNALEIRNCLKRVDCLKQKMADLLHHMDNEFDSFKDAPVDHAILSKETWNRVDSDIQVLFNRTAEHLKVVNLRQTAGAPYELRYSLPFLKLVPASSYFETSL